MSISYDHAAMYALIVRTKGKMMRLLGLFNRLRPFVRAFNSLKMATLTVDFCDKGSRKL